jgi:hypothetical protein
MKMRMLGHGLRRRLHHGLAQFGRRVGGQQLLLTLPEGHLSWTVLSDAFDGEVLSVIPDFICD